MFNSRYLWSALTLFAAASAQAATIDVPDDFPTLQAAIDNAESGDEIVVAKGTYSGNLQIDISGIELRGEETARTFLRAGNDDPIVQIGTLDVNVSDIVLRNLTFISSDSGVLINNSSNVSILNNVFVLDNSATAVTTIDTSNVEVVNNTFFSFDTAIDRGSDSVTVTNNIFVSANTAVTGTDDTGISFNCFASGGNVIGSDEATGDPRFADANADIRDFHLREDSPCIDQGDGNDDFDGTVADMGAYGGDFPDTKPFPVPRPSADASEPVPGSFNIELSWQPNRSYLVTGYEIHYDSDGSGPPYEGDDAEDGGGVITESPIIVEEDVTTYTLHNLSPSPAAPDAPELQTLNPSNQTLELEWSAVPDATGYRIEYGIAAVDENQTEVGNVTRHQLTGLQNGETYRVRVIALSQATYYLAVRVLSTDSPDTAKSDLSGERAISFGPESPSVPSNELTAIPEPVEPFPALPDEGDLSCFIATAAFGHAAETKLRILRDFRDRYLMKNSPGRAFVRAYYRYSPPLAALIAEHEFLKALVRWLLLPAVAAAYFLLHMSAHAQLAMLSGFLLCILAIVRRLSTLQKRAGRRNG